MNDREAPHWPNLRKCGICGVEDIPRFVDWGYWLDSKPVHKACAPADKCHCGTCDLSRRIQKYFPDMTPDQRSVIDELWNRMECAELDLNVIEAKKDWSWPTGDEE